MATAVGTSEKLIKVSFATNGGQVKEVEVPRGSHVAAILEKVNYKPRRGETISLNGKPVKLGGLFGSVGPAVKEGDNVMVSPKISGGL